MVQCLETSIFLRAGALPLPVMIPGIALDEKEVTTARCRYFTTASREALW